MFFRRMFSRKDNDSSSPPPAPLSIADNNNRSISVVQKSPLKRRSSTGDDKRGLSVLQLTPLWEHIIRTRTLPNDLNPAEMFEEFLERLRDPEWQVRQHALRVLIDVLIVIGQKADTYFAPIVPQLVENLGHPAPTVRKGALDALRVYIAETAMPETILLEIMDIGLNQRITNEPFGGRLTCGVMLSLPSLVQAILHTSKRNYILRSTIDMLVNKMTQVTHQEITLKVLLRIRDLIGPREFSEYMTHGAYREFELLCNVYGLSEPESLMNTSSRSSWHPIETFDQEDGETSSNQTESYWRTDEDLLLQNESESTEKIIMETEIKINEDTLTMRILESTDEPVEDGAPHEMCSEDEDEITAALENSGLIHVLTDSELEEININADLDFVPRTPKRVTFGGEIVKMRTPDSDTTVQSDGDSVPLSNNGSKLETLKFLTVDIPNDNTKPPQRSKSAQISSPRGSDSPASPRRLSSDETRIKSASPFRRISISPVDAIVSPKPMHKEIEVMHNLQRSPCVSPPRTSRQNSLSNESDEPPKILQPATPQLPIAKSWEDLGIVDQSVIQHLKSGDWQHRAQAISAIENVLRSSETLAKIQPCLDSFLRMLLSSEKNPEVAEDKRRIVLNLISRLPLDNLENRSTQIITGLCRQGGAGSNRVSKALMQRLPPSFIVLKLLSDDFVHARSSRFRENALQMVMYALMTFPSTCFDTATCIARTTYAALDRKKRVRQASLDVFAVLGQVTSPRTVMDGVQAIAVSRETGEDLCAAVKARLSRKQLPMVGTDGSVQYALRVPSPQYNDPLPDPNMGADVEWIVSGIGSVSPTSLRRRSQRFTRSSKPIGIQQDRSKERRLKAPHEILALGVGVKPVEDFISSSSGSFQGNSDDTDDSRTNLQFSLATGNSVQRNLIKTNNEGGGDILGIYGKRIASRSHSDLLNNAKNANSDSSGGKHSKLPVTSRFPAMERFDVQGLYVDRQSFRNPYELNFSQHRLNSTYPKVNYSGGQRKLLKGNYAQESFVESKFDESPRPTSHPAYESPTATAIQNPKRFMNVEKIIMQSNKQQQQQQQYPQQQYIHASNQRNSPVDHHHPPTPDSKIFTASRIPSSQSIKRDYEELHNTSSSCIESSEHSSEEQCSSHHSTPTKIIGDGSSSSFNKDNETRANTPSNKSITTEAMASRPQSVVNKVATPVALESKPDAKESRPETALSAISTIPVDEVDQAPQEQAKEEIPAAKVEEELKAVQPEVPAETVVENEPTITDIAEAELEHLQPEVMIAIGTPKTSPETLSLSRSLTPISTSINNIFESPLPIRSVSVGSLNQIPPQESLPPTNPPTPIIPKESSAITKSTESILESESKSATTRFDSPEKINQRASNTKSTESVFNKIDLDSKSTASTTSSDYPPSHATSLDEPIRSKNLFTAVKAPHLPLIRKSKTTLFGRNRKISPVKQSIKLNQAEVFPQSLTKFDKPKEALNQSLNQLESTEWETVVVGLRSLVRIMRYHPDIMDTQMHIVCMQLGKAVRNLRSQVSRAACQAATELFTVRTKFLEQECDDLASNLLHRTADTNRFLRADATRALESMCDYLSPPKIIHVLSTRGAAHQNAAVRTTTAKLLNRFADRIGYDRIFNMNRDHRDKLLLMGANLLMEGSLETRSYTKALFRLLAEHPSFARTIKEVIPTRTYRNIEKSLKSIC